MLPARAERVRVGDLFLPGQPASRADQPSQTQQCVRGHHHPNPGIRRRRGVQFRSGPAQILLQEPEGVFQIEAAQVHRPPVIHFPPAIRDRFGHQQPHRFGPCPPGRCWIFTPITVPSMITGLPWSSAIPTRVSSFGCLPSKAMSFTCPHRASWSTLV